LYRLNTVEIRLPPLRERLEDLEKLAMGFMLEFGAKQSGEPPALSGDALQLLQDYAWPGNVRELRHVLERAIILSAGEEIGAEHLMLEQGPPKQAAPDQVIIDTALTLDEIEKQNILARITHCRGNMQETARSLGLSRSAFYRRIDKYQL
jgi:DNA-binding NtrC family response regulator